MEAIAEGGSPPYLSQLGFYRRIFSDLLQSGDALLVLARGLGARTLLVRLIRLYSTMGDLEFVLNASRGEYGVLLQLLEADGVPRGALPRLLDAGTPAALAAGARAVASHPAFARATKAGILGRALSKE
jgi:hypothetical protein